MHSFVICVSAGVMYWGDAHVDRIETSRTDGHGRRLVGTEDTAHYFAFLFHDDDIYITDWARMYVCLFFTCSETVRDSVVIGVTKFI